MRLKQDVERDADKAFAKFQSHCGAIKTEGGRNTGSRPGLFQSHCGAIKTGRFAVVEITKETVFQSHCGAIKTRRLIGPLLAENLCFNPTVVRLKLTASEAG